MVGSFQLSENVNIINGQANPVIVSELNHNLLDGAVDQDTTASTVVQGDLVLGNSTPKWTRLGIGATANYLRSNATTAAWAALAAADLSGAIAQANCFAGTMVLLNGDSVQASNTVVNADTTQKTYALAANSFTSILVEAYGDIGITSTSTNQIVNFKIKDAGTQKGSTQFSKPTANTAINWTTWVVKAIFAETSSVSLTITAGAAGTDANTTVNTNGFFVYGVV